MYPNGTSNRRSTRKTNAARRAAFTSALALGLLLTAGCERVMNGPKKDESEQTRPDKIVSFDALYGANCAGCHGVDGKNGPSVPMNNPVYMALVTDDQIRQITANGQKGTLMPAFGRNAGGLLTEDQVNVLVSGMRERWGKSVAGLNPPPYAAHVSGDAAHGNQLYATGCASCHGPVAGTGALSGPAGKAGSIVDATFLTLMSDQTLRTIVIAGRPDIGQPDWRGDIPGRPLTDQEITDVVAWMSSLRQPVPGTIAAGPGQTHPDPAHRDPSASELQRRVQ